MELNQIRYFVAVCEARNMTHAAEQLFISQQALSKSMNELSLELGVPLFIREPRGVALTIYAQALLPKAKQLLFDMQDITASMTRMRDEQFHCFRLGILVGSYSFQSALPVRVIDEVARQFPSIDIRISEHSHDELISLLLRGDLHAAYGINMEQKKSHSMLLTHETYCALLSAKHPLANQRSLTLDMLKNDLLIHNGAPHYFPSIITLTKTHGGCTQELSGSVSSIIEHVRLGHGYTIAGKAFFMSFNLRDMVVLPIEDIPPLRHELSVAWDEHLLPKTAREIISALCAHAQSLE